MMRQAIVTKYLGPTNVRGSRVKATSQAGSVTLHWDDALDQDGNHSAACVALATKLGWFGDWIGGGMPDGSGQCYVLVEHVPTDHEPSEWDRDRISLGIYVNAKVR